MVLISKYIQKLEINSESQSLYSGTKLSLKFYLEVFKPNL